MSVFPRFAYTCVLIGAMLGAAPAFAASGLDQRGAACVATATARSRASLWSMPDQRSGVLVAAMARGDSALITGRLRDRSWYRVVFAEREGWVQSRLVRTACAALVPIVPPTAIATPTATVMVQGRASVGFEAQPVRIFSGACSMLTWRSQPGVKLNFVEGDRVIDVSRTAGVIVCPAATTAYLLHVQPGDAPAFHEVAIVTVAQPPTPTPLPVPTLTPLPTLPPPQMNMQADAPAVVLGACTVLKWQVTEARAVYLWEGAAFQPVGAVGSRVVCPQASTIYLLRAAGIDGAWYERSAGVTVLIPTVPPWLVTPMP